jgi:hypothetical protein
MKDFDSTAVKIEELAVLQTTNLSLGSIETNIETVLEAVKEKSRQYQDIAKYNGDEKKAKDDRAMLRKQKDMTKTTIATIQEMWNKPLEAFLSGGKEILKQFDIAIDTIDEWVKEGEAREKAKKREEIQAYFDAKNFGLVPLDKFFNPKWLNKTVPIREAREEIDSIIQDIYSSIKTLEAVAEHGAAAKAFYLETLDIGAAMRRVETLKANAERLAREKAEREERERQALVAANAAEERREERAAVKEEQMQSFVDEALDLEPDIDLPSQPKIIEYVLKFRGTKEQLFKLREYMTQNGISYEKVN